MGSPKTFLIFGESGGTSRPHQLAEWFGLCDLVAERDCKKQVYYIHSSTAAMKNMPMIPMVSITILTVLLSIIVQILQLNNLVFQIRCKGTALKRLYKSEVTKKCKKSHFFPLEHKKTPPQRCLRIYVQGEVHVSKTAEGHWKRLV